MLFRSPRCNVAFLAALTRASEFRQGKVDTGFIDRNLTALGAVPHKADFAAAALGTAYLLKRKAGGESPDGDASPDEPAEASSPWAASDGFQLGGMRSHAVPVTIDGVGAVATVSYGADGMRVAIEGAAPATDARVFEADDEAYVWRHGRQTRERGEFPRDRDLPVFARLRQPPRRCRFGLVVVLGLGHDGSVSRQ